MNRIKLYSIALISVVTVVGALFLGMNRDKLCYDAGGIMQGPHCVKIEGEILFTR